MPEAVNRRRVGRPLGGSSRASVSSGRQFPSARPSNGGIRDRRKTFLQQANCPVAARVVPGVRGLCTHGAAPAWLRDRRHVLVTQLDISPLAPGGLVNAFIFAARVQTLVDVLAETMPWHEHLFRTYRRLPTGVLHLKQIEDRLPSADYSRDVLEQAPGRLAVVRVPPCGWRDLGTPAALFSYRRQMSAVA